MEHIKLQAGCLIILLYIAFSYFRERRIYKQKQQGTLFVIILTLAIASVILDGATAYTVNHLDTVNPVLNIVLHGLFLLSLDSVIFAMCLYMLFITDTFPRTKTKKFLLFLPYAVNAVVVTFSAGSLEYRIGKVTNYSMGLAAYTCYITATFYTIFSICIFLKKWNYIESHKRVSIFTYLMVMTVVTGIQMIFPETLISSIATTVFIIGLYLNLENPVLKHLSVYQSETVMAFANLIENRDNSTGGHIKRTSAYVELIAEALRSRKEYKSVLTKDYMENLIKAAPMHDIGKVAISDAILQKPGKLTDEEFTIMKQHAAHGGEIIRETFRNLGSEEYRKMACEVARYHHEKWNGRGYPEGLKQEEIPLSARIMAVADVFDAVSEKRCYRDAMPLEQCFDIIAKGSGQDFDPVVAEAFLSIRDKIESVHRSFETAAS